MEQEIVASRALICNRAELPAFEVTISLTKPFHDLGSDSWQTIITLDGGEIKDQMTISGQDSLQSLLLAIKALQHKLVIHKKNGYAMNWYADAGDGLSWASDLTRQCPIARKLNSDQ